MESDREISHEHEASEPILQVVEGDAQEPVDIVEAEPSAFDSVMAQQGKPAKSVEPEIPVYKNRAFIAAICLIGGALAGRIATSSPKTETKVVPQPAPAAAKSTPTTPTEAPQSVDATFHAIDNLNDFDPWQPLDQGLPLPPKETQAKVIERSTVVASTAPATNAKPNFSPAPPSIGGHIVPLDPGDIGPLPEVGRHDAIDLPSDPVPGGQPDANAKPTAAGNEHYLSISMNGPEPVKGQEQISGIASSLGGTARTFTHMKLDSTVEAQGVLVIVPAAKFAEAQKRIEALGGASIDSVYNGPATDRQSELQSTFSTRLSKLQDRRKDLLVQFLDDAQPVKQINEAIDFETRAVAATRLSGDMSGKAVILVRLK
ncbi:MAG: hypothetical protein JST51_18840 [Armatimonadetes bacterium]|nr:hypothetical protein [Armatimonadota bacterium]